VEETKKTILVVDDSVLDRRLATRLLEGRGDWVVEQARDGVEALAAMGRRLPSAVVTDLQMPELDGLALVEAVRARYPAIPVVLMTAHGSEDLAVRALQVGAASYVPKRQLGAELRAVLESVLSAADLDQKRCRLLSCLESSEYDFRLENDLSLIPEMVALHQENFAAMGLCDGTDRIRIGLALGEVLSNAMIHGNLEVSSSLREDDDAPYFELAQRRCTEAPYRARRVSLISRLSRPEIRVEVRDEGPGFDTKNMSDPTDPANLEKSSGRGLFLIRAFMDEVIFNDHGNQVTLVKRFDPQTPAPDAAAFAAQSA
jgi:CheY-like chemotaxis protein/anti-sigma regulatory factor (Ser/Thr protein kinase)